MVKFIKRKLSSISFRLRRIALNQHKSGKTTFAAVLLNVSLAYKLCAALVTLGSFLLINKIIKEGPPSVILIEAALAVFLCFITVYATKQSLMYRNKKLERNKRLYNLNTELTALRKKQEESN